MMTAEATMTNREWQERYEITSVRGNVSRRGDLRSRATRMASSLLGHAQRREVVLATVDLVLDDDAFMRPRRGMIPARVVEDAAFEAFHRLAPGAHR